MKLLRLLFLTIIIHQFSIINCTAQSGTWTWMGGDSTLNSIGNYGVKGIATAYDIPSSRYACGYWTDTAGCFWIYSGLNAIDDLWKFDPQVLEWTWMTGTEGLQEEVINAPIKGVYDSLNDPGALAFGMLTWVTPDNHLWLFGGLHNYGTENINNDLWQYNPAINQWAWMGTFGPVNYGMMGVGNDSTMPGGRQEGNSAWVDNNGNLWLFGGCDQTYFSYNDVWEYNVSTGIWTWMSGSQNLDDLGQYGVIGRPWIDNYPSGRSTNLFWKDAEGDFWLAGGSQYTNGLMFQDVWEFDPQNLYWTWVSGPIGEDTITAGANCTYSDTNQAGPRFQNRSWQLNPDQSVTYGGFTNWAGNTVNDMWAYSSSAAKWIKMNVWDSTGSYGSPGVGSPANYPTHRYGGASFIAKDKSLWMFGGQNNGGFLNDLWKYIPDSACIRPLGCSATFTLYPDTSAANTYYALNQAYGTGPLSYIWSWGDGDTSSGATPSHIYADSGYYNICLTITDSADCTSTYCDSSTYLRSTQSLMIYVDVVTSLPTSTGIPQIKNTSTVSIYPNPASTQLFIKTTNFQPLSLTIYDMGGRKVTGGRFMPQMDISALASGLYFVEIANDNVTERRRFVKL